MSITNDLQKRAILVSCTIHTFNNMRSDKATMLKATQTINGTGSEDAYLQALLPEGRLHPIRKATRNLRKLVEEYSLPWAASLRIMPSAKLFEFREAYGTALAEFDKAVDDVAHDYSDLYNTEHRRRGDLFMEDAYPPTAHHFKKRHWVDLNLMPMPDMDDFRLSLSPDLVNSIQQETTNAWLSRLERIQDLWKEDLGVRAEAFMGKPYLPQWKALLRLTTTISETQLPLPPEIISIVDLVNMYPPNIKGMEFEISNALKSALGELTHG